MIQESYISTIKNLECFEEVRGNLNDWIVREYETLFLTLIRIRLDRAGERPFWSLNARGIFFVRFVYNHLTTREATGRDFPSKEIWKVNASLIIAFSQTRQLEDAF